jgi:uncharacterized membrane protein
MLSPLWVLRILSAIVGLTSIVTNFEHPTWCSFCGMVFVTCVDMLKEHLTWNQKGNRPRALSMVAVRRD